MHDVVYAVCVCRTDGSVFSLCHLQACMKTFAAVVHDLLYAYDCALMAHTQTDVQQPFSQFLNAATCFGLTVSLRKTEVKPVFRLISSPPVIMAGETALPAVKKFCYLGSTLSSDANIDNDISWQLAKDSHSFGRLSRRLWDDHRFRLDTKVAVYKAVILTALFYASETWVVYRWHVRKLEQFNMRCLRHLAHVRWQEKKSNTEVLQICNIGYRNCHRGVPDYSSTSLDWPLMHMGDW